MSAFENSPSNESFRISSIVHIRLQHFTNRTNNQNQNTAANNTPTSWAHIPLKQKANDSKFLLSPLFDLSCHLARLILTVVPFSTSTVGFTTVLIELCKHEMWDKIRQRAHDHPETIPLGDEHGRAALHFALENPRTPFDVIQCLSTEDSLKARDSRTGARPLHTACANNASLEIVKLLARPAALMATDHFGKIPLHTACAHQASLEVIMFLTNACPRSLEVPDAYGRLAIHHACDHPRYDVVIFLARQCPDSLKKLDGASELPLHHLCDHAAPAQLMQFLVDQLPDSLWARDYYGKTPLDHWEAHHHDATEKQNAMILNPCF